MARRWGSSMLSRKSPGMSANRAGQAHDWAMSDPGPVSMALLNSVEFETD